MFVCLFVCLFVFFVQDIYSTTGTVGAPAKIDPCRARVKGPDLIFLKNVEMPKKGRKLVEKYFSLKCPKSISLDSGHLD